MDQGSARGATAPQARIDQAAIDAQIEYRTTFNGAKLNDLFLISVSAVEALKNVTVALVVLKNGRVTLGYSQPDDPVAPIRPAIAEAIAYQGAIAAAWPFMKDDIRRAMEAASGQPVKII